MRDRFSGETAARTRSIFDHEWFPEPFRQALTN
jgi:hypothetical protein